MAQYLTALAPDSQQRLAVAMDVLLCAAATWIALALRIGILAVAWEHFLLVLGLALTLWLPIAHYRGVYQSILRYAGGRTMAGLAVAGAIVAALLSMVLVFLEVDGLPRTVGLLQPIVFVGLLGASRLFVRFVLVELAGTANGMPVRRVMIYGAGRAGQQLELSLRHETHLRVVGYLDDNPRLRHQRLDWLKVHHPDDLPGILSQLPIDEVLLAMPRISRTRRREIIENLQQLHISVRYLPSTAKIIDDKLSISDLRPVSVLDLLGRDVVPADDELLKHAILDRVVVVSGAGGSIGSELCRQILAIGPKSLVLFEQSEYSLYRIDEELRADAERLGVELIMELGSVSNPATVKRLFSRWKPQTVFHAAAYKHVPIVERNPISGAFNNIFGTLFLADEAEKFGVERFILISTDKAVRPTNIMGATKRVCELILQARAARGSRTCFTMVRFGNVLGSSGSVVPKFSAQIESGGPITLTHRDVTRYFMAIPEAAQLVIQAGAMAEGGDVFVLDMGEPVRIYDLACTMIELSGLTLRSDANPGGDIEIIEVGLRPGEKKYEELLIGANPMPTRHPRIIKAHESHLSWPELEHLLSQLAEAIRSGEAAQVRRLISTLVPDYREVEAVEVA